ncbi:MAG: thioredoxin-disulfide reductase [Clostridiales bacterium]|jgi:thioredoxin reductase (NADPH)|nr:thioredoxin-disulfide reductase [Clostridiales bacterium]
MKTYDLIVIGGGAAGMAAAVYGRRAGLSVLVIEAVFHGGQAAVTPEIDNYIGFSKGISGADLMENFHAHATRFGAEFAYEQVLSVLEEEGAIRVITTRNEYKAGALVIAAGAAPRQLGVDGEAKFVGTGVSYCATCDGTFFSKKTVAVVGGGNTAAEDAIYLSKICEKVYMIHRRDTLRAEAVIAETALKEPKIEIVWDSVVDEIQGGKSVESLKIHNVKTEESRELSVNGVFIAVGIRPNTDIFKGIVDMDEHGFIITDECMRTRSEGRIAKRIYAAGDVRATPLRQVITAAADGAIAAYYANKAIGVV